MTRANKALAVLMVAALGLWGCAQGPSNGPGSAERIKSLENKCNKLDEDYRAVAAVRDQLRAKLNDVEEQRTKLRKELDVQLALLKDHENIKAQLTARTQERDNLQNQFEVFRKGIRNLLGQAEAALPAAPAQPAVSVADGNSNNKS
jgi:TolA-binding protein